MSLGQGVALCAAITQLHESAYLGHNTPFEALMLPFALLLISVPLPPAISSCTSGQIDPVVVLGPRSGEADVPLNTSLWLSVLDANPRDLVVRLFDDAQLEIPLQLELLHQLERRATVRAVLQRELAPERRYSLEWRLGESSGGHVFDTGRFRDDNAPEPPRLDYVQGSDARTCGGSFEIGVKLLESRERPDLLHEGTTNGAVAGFTRGLDLVLQVGTPDLEVVGGVIALDLAGNRSPSTGYRSTTPTILDDTSGCSSTQGADTSVTLAWLVVVLGARAGARRGWRGRR